MKNKIKYFIAILIFLSFCACRTVNENPKNKSNNSFEISAIDTKFPLKISDLNLEQNNIIQLNDYIISKIKQSVKNYYEEDCINDSLHTYKDTYINTIRFQDSLQTIYLVLLKHYPSGELNSKVLFYNNQKKEFEKNILDFKIYALYHFENGKFNHSNLKTDFKITSPEIEIVDFNKDGINDYQFTRLFHNGTFNSIQTTILTINNSTIDTLYFNEKGLGEFAEK